MSPSGRHPAPSDPAGRALDALERGAVAGIRVARALHGRWRRMSAGERTPLAPFAREVKERALDLRGEADRAAAQRDLRDANDRLVDAMVESASADPDLSEIEVRDLRDELARELERLADADIRAARGPGHGAVADGPGAADGSS